MGGRHPPPATATRYPPPAYTAHYLVVRGTAADDPNLVIIPGLVPLVSTETGEIEYVVAHTEWARLDATTPVSG